MNTHAIKSKESRMHMIKKGREMSKSVKTRPDKSKKGARMCHKLRESEKKMALLESKKNRGEKIKPSKRRNCKFLNVYHTMVYFCKLYRV